jgi:hypothetical protein
VCRSYDDFFARVPFSSKTDVPEVLLCAFFCALFSPGFPFIEKRL